MERFKDLLAVFILAAHAIFLVSLVMFTSVVLAIVWSLPFLLVHVPLLVLLVAAVFANHWANERLG